MISLLDTHQHLLYRENSTYAWTKDIPPLAEGNFSVDDYNSLTSGLGIAGSLFMEVDADDYHKESHFIRSLSNDINNDIKGLIVSIRPEKDEGFEDWLDETIEMKVVGFRRILHVVEDEISQSDTFRKNVRKIGEIGKTFDLCFLQRQLPLAIELAKDLIDSLDDNYKKAFEGLNTSGLGEGTITRLTQVFLRSRYESIFCLEEEIKSLDNNFKQ